MTTPETPTAPLPPEAAGGSRLAAARDWLGGRADTSPGRLAPPSFRRYFEASRNSGAAASAYIMLSVLPTALVVIALFNRARGDNAFADRLITHMRLDGATADLVHDLFGTTSNNLLAASVTVVIGFLIWGLSVGQLYQGVYARAWRVEAGTPADQLLFTIWFFVFSGLLALMMVTAGELRAAGWLVVLPAWIVGSMLLWL